MVQSVRDVRYAEQYQNVQGRDSADAEQYQNVQSRPTAVFETRCLEIGYEQILRLQISRFWSRKS